MKKSTKAKAYFKILVVGLVWILTVLISIKGWYKLTFTLVSIILRDEYLKSWALIMWIADDQDIFTLFNPVNPDITISGYVGRKALEGDKEALVIEEFINWLFSPFEDNHCRRSIEYDEKY